MSAEYKAAIFDLDGTLSESLESIAHTVNLVLTEKGHKEIELERFKVLVGDGARTLIERVLKLKGIEDAGTVEEYFARYLELFEEGCLYNLRACDGVEALVHDLKARGFKLAVLSNKPDLMTNKCVKAIFGEGVFDRIVGVKEGLKKKPDPAGALALAEEFGVRPEECLYLGDTNTDMKTGKAAGMFTIGVLWGFRDEAELRENKADAIIHKPEEVLGLLQ